MSIETDKDGLVSGPIDNCGDISDELKRYSARKLCEAEQREQERFDAPGFIDTIINTLIKSKHR